MVKCRLFCGFVVMAFASVAMAIDLQPGELIAPPPDINQLQVAYQLSKRGDKYLNGHKVSAATKLTSGQFSLRLAHTFETADMPSVAYIQMPISYIHPGGVLTQFHQSESGVGDTTLVYALWPYANRETNSYWAIAGYLNVPTGKYAASNGDINIGKNRVAAALQSGYQTALTDNVNWMAALDSVWYGTNDNFYENQLSSVKRTLDQAPHYTFQTGLQYKIDPQYSLSAAYIYTAGGETSWDGVDKNDETQVQRYQLSASGRFSFGRLMLQYGSDLKNKNGLIEDRRLIVRYFTVF